MGQASRVQAATVRLRMAYVEQKHGVEARQRFMMQASPALREVLSAAPGKSAWVDFELFVEATVLVDRMFGRGDMALAWDIGRFAAGHEIGVWKSLIMRVVRPSMLLGVVSGVWSHHYDSGRLVSRVVGPTAMLVGIENFPTPHRAHCYSIAGWIHGSLEQGPRKNINVRELSCRAHGGRSCEFQLDWAE